MEKLMDLNMPPDSHPSAKIGCSYKFTGYVESGDLDKFKSIEEGQTIVVVCLDSPGGSFREAISIGAYLKDKMIGTKLEAGTQCLSACSLVFMAGSYYAHETGALRWRIMHPTAKLGFHVPSLKVRDGNYDQESVTKAYKLAMKSMSEIIFKLITKEGYEGGNSIKASLLGHMVSTPSDSMFMIDTIDKAGRWDIMVGPTKNIHNISDKQFYLACENIVKWTKDESATGLEYFSDPSVLSTWVKRKTESGQLSITTIVDEFNGTSCKFTTNEKIPDTAKAIWGGIENAGASQHIYSGTFMLATTPLNSLAPPEPDLMSNRDSNQNLCAVMQHDSYSQIGACTKTVKQISGRQTTVFTWSSGSKTVLVKNGRKYSVNGAPAKRPELINGYVCINNPKTANSFCHKSLN